MHTALEVLACLRLACAGEPRPERTVRGGADHSGLLRSLERGGVARLEVRRMVEALVQGCCLTGRLDQALGLYDEAKDGGLPLARITLAQLEAVCKADSRLGWRVYDVCAQMRAQREREGVRRAPRKASHHVGPQ